LEQCPIIEKSKPMEFWQLSHGADKQSLEVLSSYWSGKALLTPNLVHRKTKSSGIPRPKSIFWYKEGYAAENVF